jgi:hypothetical protein
MSAVVKVMLGVFLGGGATGEARRRLSGMDRPGGRLGIGLTLATLAIVGLGNGSAVPEFARRSY